MEEPTAVELDKGAQTDSAEPQITWRFLSKRQTFAVISHRDFKIVIASLFKQNLTHTNIQFSRCEGALLLLFQLYEVIIINYYNNIIIIKIKWY